MKVAAYLIELAGLAGLFYGVWQIFPPAAYIVAGLLLIALAQTVDTKDGTP